LDLQAFRPRRRARWRWIAALFREQDVVDAASTRWSGGHWPLR
jgi:hypothetical protein